MLPKVNGVLYTKNVFFSPIQGGYPLSAISEEAGCDHMVSDEVDGKLLYW